MVRKNKNKNKNKNRGSAGVFWWDAHTRLSQPPGAAHVVRSALNGSNGSFTNTDDHDNAARVRLNKQSRTNRLRAGGSNKKNTRYGPPDVEQPPAGPVPPQYDPTTGLPMGEEIEIRKYIIVSADKPFWCYDGKVFGSSTPLCTQVTMFNGTVHQHVWTHSIHDHGGMNLYACHGTSHPGYIITDKPVPAAATPAIVETLFAQAEFGGVYYPPENNVHFIPGYLELCRSLPHNGKPNLTRKQTALGLLTKFMSPMLAPAELIFGTLDYWFRMELTGRASVETTTTLRQLGVGPVSIYDPITLPLSRGVALESTFEQHYKRQAEECIVEPDWVYKETFGFECNGAIFDPISGMHPFFMTASDPNRTSRYNKTVMCSFSGPGGQFMLYDVSGENMCLAFSKRLLACRGDQAQEDSFYRQQAGALRAIHDLLNPLVLETLRVRLAEDVLVIGRGAESHIVVANELGHEYLRGYIDVLLSRCTPTVLEGIVSKYKNTKHWVYSQCLEKYSWWQDYFSARDLAAKLPHRMQKLRIQYVAGVELHTSDDNMVRTLEGNVKKEWAKAPIYRENMPPEVKVPRLYVSYGAGSMYANELPELIKVCLSKAFFFPQGHNNNKVSASIFIMAKPKSESLSYLFNQLIHATTVNNHMTVVIYSDDSVYAGCVDGVPFGYNVDISGCDSSNNSLVFGTLGSMLSNFSCESSCGLLRQCMAPILMVNPENKNETIKVKFHSAFEGSGTVLTTILNHTASYLIAVSVLDQLNNNPIGQAIVQGAKNVGHKVTLESFADGGSCVFERMQFLKYSPMLTTEGKWVPVINYGCIFRGFGSIDGDLEPKHLNVSLSEFRLLPWNDRLDRFASSVVNGLINEPETRVMRALRTRFAVQTETSSNKRFLTEMLESAPSDKAGLGEDDKAIPFNERGSLVVDEASFCKRYGIDTTDVEYLCKQISDVRVGRDCVSDAVAAFYELDYGMAASPSRV